MNRVVFGAALAAFAVAYWPPDPDPRSPPPPPPSIEELQGLDWCKVMGLPVNRCGHAFPTETEVDGAIALQATADRVVPGGHARQRQPAGVHLKPVGKGMLS